MDDFKKLTERLLKIYINAGSVNNLGIENYFDENISLIGTGKHELFTNLHEFLESFKFDVKRRGKIRLEVRNLHQEEERLDDDHVLAHGTVDFTGLFKDGSICFKMETRFTIIYKWTNGKWLGQHLHHSTPNLEQMDGEEFPLALGEQVKKNRQALHALGTAYYHISRLNLKTKKIELVKRSREMDMGIKENTADWNPQFKIIEDIIAEPFVQKYMEFFDIQTMAARLHNKESMSSEFKKKDGSWFLSMVVPQSYDKNGNVLGVSDDEIVNYPYDIANLKYEGTRDPLLSGGLNTRVSYKNISLSMLFAFGLKNVVRLPGRAYVMRPADDENANSSIKDRWRPGHDNTGKVIPALSEGSAYISTAQGNFYATDWYNASDKTVIPGDYLRFRNLMLEYQLPVRWTDKVVVGDRKLGNVTLKFQAQNLFVIADKRLKGYDPETINYTTTSYGSLPLATTFTLGLNINF